MLKKQAYNYIEFSDTETCSSIFKKNMIIESISEGGPPPLSHAYQHVLPDSSRRCEAYQEAPEIKSRDPTPCKSSSRIDSATREFNPTSGSGRNPAPKTATLHILDQKSI